MRRQLPVINSNIETLQATHDELFVTVYLSDVTVEADEMIVEVAGNILINAVEYTNPGPVESDVTAEVDDRAVDLRVADN